MSGERRGARRGPSEGAGGRRPTGGRRDDLPRRLGDIITPALGRLAGGRRGACVFRMGARRRGSGERRYAPEGVPPRAAHHRMRVLGVGQRVDLPRPADPAAHGRGGAGSSGQAVPLRRRPPAGASRRRRGRGRWRDDRASRSPSGRPAHRAAGRRSRGPRRRRKSVGANSPRPTRRRRRGPRWRESTTEDSGWRSRPLCDGHRRSPRELLVAAPHPVDKNRLFAAILAPP